MAMNDDEEAQVSDVTTMASEIVAAFVSQNTVKADEVPEVIKAVHGCLQEIVQGKTRAAMTVNPAVPIRGSVKPDYIVCLEDGRKFKSIKRHLRTAHGMTPDDYRARWNLSSDYPMVCPRYAAERAALARSIGLGKGRKQKSAETERS